MDKSVGRSSGDLSLTLVERVKPILEEIRERALSIEQARQIPEDIIHKLVDIGFIRAMVPAEHGGGEEEFLDWIETVRLISASDMATGWVAGLLSCHAHAVTFFDKRAQDEVWATGPDTIIGTTAAPVGRIRRVTDGVYLTGRFPFASGCDHGAWTILGFTLPVGDVREAGNYACLVPRSDYTILDDWFTSGLRGTGSKSLILEDVFVPEHRWFGPTFERPANNPGLYKNPMFNSAFQAIFNAPFAAIMVGGAEGALSWATAALKSRVSPFSGLKAIDYPPRQISIAEAALEIRTAAALMEQNWAKRAEALRDGRIQTPQEIRWWRAEDAYASKLARHAVDQLMNDAGGSAQYSNKPLQRFWRDIHTGCEHPWLDLLAMKHVVGRLMLGLPRDPTLVM